GNDEAWVVNQLSDDVSIVNLQTMNVRATLHVGDEPADVVFAGNPVRAWVSVSQEDALKLYDPANLAAAPQVVAIPARKPRSLSVTPDGALSRPRGRGGGLRGVAHRQPRRAGGGGGGARPPAAAADPADESHAAGGAEDRTARAVHERPLARRLGQALGLQDPVQRAA